MDSHKSRIAAVLPDRFWRYFIKSRVRQFILFLVAVVILVAIGGQVFHSALPGWVANFDVQKLWTWAEPLMSVLILIVTSLVAVSEVHQEWRDHLPKRLDVVFIFDGKPLMECRGARLAGVSDIRALAQQIGLQMANLDKLRFKVPDLRSSTGELSKGSLEMCYRAIVVLDELPGTSLTGRTVNFKKLVEGGQCLVWKSPDFGDTEESQSSVAANWRADFSV